MSDKQLFNLNGDPSDAASLPHLPSSWCWASLEDLIQNFDGRRIPVKSDDRDKRSGPYPYYGASGVIDDIDDFIFDGDYLLIAEDGANLLSRSTPIAFRASGRFWVNNHAHIVQMRGGIPLAYLQWYLNGTNLQFFITGTAQPKLNQVNLNRIPVPVAPIAEQSRIVAKIEELFSDLDAGVTALKRAKANLKRYRAAVLKAAVEGNLTEEWRAKHPAKELASTLLARILKERRQKWETDQLAKFAAAEKEPPKNWREKYVEPKPPDTSGLAELPEGWCWANVDQICDVGTGTTPSRTNSNYYKDGSIPWIMSSAVNLPFVDEASEFVTELALQETTLRLYPVGTLILALYGEGKTRGMVSELRIEATVNQALGALVFNDSAVLIRPFVKVFLASNYVQLRRQAAGGMQPNLNLGIVKQIAIPLPPIDEQAHIVGEVATRVSQIDDTETTIDHDLFRADRLRQSILKQTFEGKLVPQEPEDEPASILLKRILSLREPAVTNDEGAKARRPKRPQMKTSRERLPLVQIVATHPKGISPDDAFRAAGYDQENVNDVDSFYAELDRAVKSKAIEVQRPDESTVLLTPRAK